MAPEGSPSQVHPEVQTEPASLGLGTHAVLKLCADPAVRLAPDCLARDCPATSINQYKIDSIVLGGECKNLEKEVPCRLEWRVVSDAFPEKAVAHPRKTVLVVNGSRYEVKEKENESSQAKSLRWSAFELGVVGKGTLGYSIRLELLGNQLLEVEPSQSRISFDLPAAIELIVTEESGGVSDRVVVERDASHPLGMGRRTKLRPNFSDGFRECKFHVKVSEVRPDGSSIEDTEQTLEWVRGADAPPPVPWLVGSMLSQAGDGPTQPIHYTFVRLPKRSAVSFVYELEITPPQEDRGARTPGAHGSPDAPSIQLSRRPLCWMSPVSLEHLTLEWKDEPGNRWLVLDGALTGVAGDGEFPMEVELFVFKQDAPSIASRRLADCGVSCRTLAVEVKGGKFSCTELVAPGELEKEGVMAHLEDRALFAELRLPPGCFGPGTRRMPFDHFVEYKVMEASGSAGFAPSTDGQYESWTDAVGVTSNWITLAGGSGLVKVHELDVPPERLEEFSWFLAAICGEAIGQHEASWRGVAHVIMNRVRHGGFGGGHLTDAKMVVQAPGEFSSYRNKDGLMTEQFKKGLSYCDDSKRGSIKTEDQDLIGRIKKATLPIFLGKAGRGMWAVQFFSPSEQAKQNRAPPAFALPSSGKIDVTKEIYGAAAWDDFRFYRMPTDNPDDARAVATAPTVPARVSDPAEGPGPA